MSRNSSRRQRPPIFLSPLQPIAIAVALAVGLPVGAATAHAQTSSAAVQRFDLPAGALDATLTAIARQAGRIIVIEPALVNGLKAAPVQGELTMEQAFTRALSGSGLELTEQNGGTLGVKRAETATLKAVKVQAAGFDGTTEGTGSYTTGSINTATRLNLSPRETPQTVTVVTRQQIDDFAMSDMDEVLERTSGVHVFDRGANGAFYYSRGFPMQAQYDGLAHPTGIGEWNTNPSPDSAVLDHAEILQGASGLLTGAGEVGGVINLVRKRPTKDALVQVEGLVGSWDKKRLVGDVSGALVDSGNLRGRAVAVWDEADSFVDYVFDEKKVFYSVVDADITQTTTLFASVHYQENDGLKPSGVPMGPDGSDLHFSRSTYIGNAEASHRKEFLLYTVGLEQQLSNDWLFKAAYNDNTTDVDNENGSFPTGGPLNVATGSGLNLMQYRYLEREFTSNAWDMHAIGPVQLFNRQHELVVGANGVELHERSRNSGNSATPINVYNFDPRLMPIPPGVRAPLDPEDTTEQYGAYAVARLNLADSLKLIVGGRVSWYEYVDSDGAQLRKETGEVTPYAGLVYDLNSQLSLYTSYSEIFTPQAERSRSGSPIEPVVGGNYEIGIKGEFREGRLNAAAAIFRLDQTNLPTEDEAFGDDPTNVCGGWCYIAQDEIVSEGVDLSLDGELLPGWNVGGGYTYVSSEYNTGELQGNPFRTDVPKNLFRAYTTYRIGNTGLVVGGNVNVQSRFYSEGVRSGIAWRVEQGGLAVVGLMAKYDVDRNIQVSLNADNIFDRRYFASTNSLYYVPYGEPRSFTLSARYRFD